MLLQNAKAVRSRMTSLSRSARDAGFTLVEVMVAVGLVGVAGLGASKIMLDANKLETAGTTKMWLEVRRLEFSKLMASNVSWNQLKNLNPDMECFDSGTGCSAFRNSHEARIKNGQTVLNGRDPHLGLTKSGDYCYTFAPRRGNDACPIGLDISWRALCDSAQCLHAQPELTISFDSKYATGGTMPLSQQTLKLYRDPTLADASELCSQMGGVLTNGVCTYPSLGSACDPANGKYALGFDAQGIPICGAVKSVHCDSDQLLTGFDANGWAICSAGCKQVGTPTPTPTPSGVPGSCGRDGYLGPGAWCTFASCATGAKTEASIKTVRVGMYATCTVSYKCGDSTYCFASGDSQ